MLRAVEQPHSVDGTKLLRQRPQSLKKTGREEPKPKRKIAILHIQTAIALSNQCYQLTVWKNEKFSLTKKYLVKLKVTL